MIHRSKKPAPPKTDPLHFIFEQHLYDFENDASDRRMFVGGVVAEYLAFLRENGIVIPSEYERPVIEELGAQVNLMLTKKIYGCYSISEFREKVSLKNRRRRSKVKKAG
jgi:hypothetical protein